MKRSISALSLLALLVVVGCSEPVQNLPTPSPVSGRVTFANGTPVKNVRLMFIPIDALAPASGLVKDDGSFALQTYDNKPGAVPGKFRVIVRVDQSGTPEQYKASSAALKLVPAKYQEDSSPLEVDIPSGGDTNLNLKLQ